MTQNTLRIPAPLPAREAGAAACKVANPPLVPACLARNEPDAIYGWFSTRRLLITKGETSISLSADDLARLKRFFEGFDMEQRS